jgi:hypothetical protein
LFSALDARKSSVYQDSHKLTNLLRGCWDMPTHGAHSFTRGVHSLFSTIPANRVSISFEGHGVVDPSEMLLKGLNVMFEMSEVVESVVGRNCFAAYNAVFGLLMRLRWTTTHLHAQMCESRRVYELFQAALRTCKAEIPSFISANSALHKLLCAQRRMHLFCHTVHDRVCSSVISEDWPTLVSSIAKATHPLAIRQAHDDYLHSLRQRCLQLPQQGSALSFLLRLYDRIDGFMERFREFYSTLMRACDEVETARQQDALVDKLLSAALHAPTILSKHGSQKASFGHSMSRSSPPLPTLLATSVAAVTPLRRLFTQCASLSRSFDSQLRVLTKSVEGAEADSALKAVVIALNYNGYYDSDMHGRRIYDWEELTDGS